ATTVPGVSISEHFPLLARRMHHLALIRSVHHADVNHLTATHELLTGRPIPRAGAALGEDWPHVGAVLAHQNRGRERSSSLPPFVQFRPTVANGAPRFVEQSHGQTAGWLGVAWNPLTIDDDPNLPGYRARAAELRLPDEIAPGRLDDRRRLLRAVDAQARA